MTFNVNTFADSVDEFICNEIQDLPVPFELSNRTILFRNLRIKPSRNNTWRLLTSTNHEVGEFQLRTCALLAAEYYYSGNLVGFYNIKSLDTFYWNQSLNCYFYSQQLNECNDFFKKNVLLAKLSSSSIKSKKTKEKIVGYFNQLFAKYKNTVGINYEPK